MSKFKISLIVVTVLYILSPVDFYPGPVDDTIVLLLELTINALIRR